MILETAKVARGTLYGVALNDRTLFDNLSAQFHETPYKTPPGRPVLFIKTPNTRNVDGGMVARPNGERLQAGPSLGVVIGKTASRIRAADALNHVLGYVLVNEFSLPEDSYYRPAIKSKCRDGFCALSTFVIPRDQVADAGNLEIRLFVNGELRQSGSTANHVRSIAQLVEELSEFMTLEAGDVLITGVPDARVDVHAGDQVVMEIPGLGSLRSLVVDEHPSGDAE